MGNLGHKELGQLHHPHSFILSAFQKLLFPATLTILQSLCNSKTLHFKCAPSELIKT